MANGIFFCYRMPRMNKTVYAKRHTNLSWAICSTLMCICFPIGLIAIFVALKSKRAWRDDRPESAGDLADMAKTIALIAILFSMIIICIFVALIASGYFYEFLEYIGVMKPSQVAKLMQEQGETKVEEIPADLDTRTDEPEYYYDYETITIVNGKGNVEDQ